MKEDEMDLVRGGGNVFRDFDYPDADIRQAKCVMAAEIMKTLDDRQWSIRKAEQETGVNHADFARIRRANIGRYSLERLAAILGRLGQEVELSIRVRARSTQSAPAGAPPS